MYEQYNANFKKPACQDCLKSSHCSRFRLNLGNNRGTAPRKGRDWSAPALAHITPEASNILAPSSHAIKIDYLGHNFATLCVRWGIQSLHVHCRMYPAQYTHLRAMYAQTFNAPLNAPRFRICDLTVIMFPNDRNFEFYLSIVSKFFFTHS